MSDFEWDKDPRVTKAGMGLTLYLMRWRSMHRVMRALLNKYPDEASFDALLQSDAYLELVGEVASVADVLQQMMQEFEGDDDRDLFQQLAAEYPRVLESVEELATLLGVDATDLASVLLNKV